jgi:hypothetical protein
MVLSAVRESVSLEAANDAVIGLGDFPAGTAGIFRARIALNT